MANTCHSIHGVTSISVKYEKPDANPGWLHFVIRAADGGYHDITAFVDRPIAIEGAEFLNFIAAHEGQPA